MLRIAMIIPQKSRACLILVALFSIFYYTVGDFYKKVDEDKSPVAFLADYQLLHLGRLNYRKVQVQKIS